MTQYGLTQVFASVIIYPFWTESTQELEVTIVSDRWETVNVTAQIAWFDWSGKQLSFQRYWVTVPPLNNTIVLSATGFDNILPKGYKETQVWGEIEPRHRNLERPGHKRSLCNYPYLLLRQKKKYSTNLTVCPCLASEGRAG